MITTANVFVCPNVLDSFGNFRDFYSGISFLAKTAKKKVTELAHVKRGGFLATRQLLLVDAKISVI